MRRTRRWLLTATIVIGGLVILVLGIGYTLPVDHVASVTATLPQAPAAVFERLTNVAAYPSWRRDVTRVEPLPGTDVKRWREHGSNGEITFEEVERRDHSKLVTRIADPSLPFGGTWTFELVPEKGGTRVTITEHGQVFNPLFRFVSRFVLGHTATLEAFIDDLSGRSER